MVFVNKEIYRKAALDRLSSPDQLDTLVKVIPGNAWFAMSGFGVLLAVGLVWGWFGSIPTTVTSQGIIINRSGLETVTSGANGRITELKVSLGDQVVEGDAIAVLAQPDLELQLGEAEQELEELIERKASVVSLQERSNRVTGEVLAQRQIALAAELDAAQENARVNKELADGRRELWENGSATRTAYLEVLQAYTEANLRAASVEGKIKGLDIEKIDAERRNTEEIAALDARIAAAERQVASVKDQISRNSIATSPFSGRVIELKTGVGAVVAIGEPIATLEQETEQAERLEVIIYPTTVDGKRITPGMEARITPTTVKREESGYLIGEISFVSDYTVSRESMRQELQSDGLVEKFSELGPPLDVRASLLRDVDNPDVLRWSSDSAEAPLISSGTLATVDIVVQRQRPLALVIPLLKRSVGLD